VRILTEIDGHDLTVWGAEDELPPPAILVSSRVAPTIEVPADLPSPKRSSASVTAKGRGPVQARRRPPGLQVHRPLRVNIRWPPGHAHRKRAELDACELRAVQGRRIRVLQVATLPGLES
jgi:hypothetical protein